MLLKDRIAHLLAPFVIFGVIATIGAAIVLPGLMAVIADNCAALRS